MGRGRHLLLAMIFTIIIIGISSQDAFGEIVIVEGLAIIERGRINPEVWGIGDIISITVSYDTNSEDDSAADDRGKYQGATMMIEINGSLSSSSSCEVTIDLRGVITDSMRVGCPLAPGVPLPSIGDVNHIGMELFINFPDKTFDSDALPTEVNLISRIDQKLFLSWDSDRNRVTTSTPFTFKTSDDSAADLELQGTVERKLTEFEEQLIYNYSITNNGPDKSDPSLLQDFFPPEKYGFVVPDIVNGPANFCFGLICEPDCNTFGTTLLYDLQCYIPPLGNGETWDVLIIVRLEDDPEPPDCSSGLTNDAKLTSGNDPNLENNFDKDTVICGPCAPSESGSIKGAKTSNRDVIYKNKLINLQPDFVPGEKIRFKIFTYVDSTMVQKVRLIIGSNGLNLVENPRVTINGNDLGDLTKKQKTTFEIPDKSLVKWKTKSKLAGKNIIEVIFPENSCTNPSTVEDIYRAEIRAEQRPLFLGPRRRTERSQGFR